MVISHSKLLNYPGASTIFNGHFFSAQRSASPTAPAKCSSESPLRAAGRWAPRAVHLRSRCFQKVAEKGGTVADCTSLNIVYGSTHLVYLECQVCQWNDTWFLWAITRCVRIVSQFPREAHYECLISKVRQGKRLSYGKQLEGFQWKVEKLKRRQQIMRKPCIFFCPFRVFGNRQGSVNFFLSVSPR